MVTCDKTGRILIPAHLIAEAHLKKEVLVIGLNRSIEIWNPERYNYYIEQFAGSYEEVAERIFSGDDGATPEQ
jgi:MraZ protein